MSVSDRIAKRIRELGIKQKDIAKDAGVSAGAVSQWVSGISEPKGNHLLATAKILKVSPDWLVSGGEMISEANIAEQNAKYLGHVDAWDSKTDLDDDEVEVPFFMDVELAAGIGGELANENRGYKLRFAKSTLRRSGVDPAAAACVKIFGNSMEPRLFDGDVVGVNTSDKHVIDGKTYAINHEGMLRVKRLYRLPGGGLRVNSLNSAEHPDEHYNADERSAISIIGRVFWHSSIWS